jgi:hypothetical protein
VEGNLYGENQNQTDEILFTIVATLPDPERAPN